VPPPSLAQVLQANPITAHIAQSNLDAFGNMKLKLPQETPANTTQAKDPPSQGDVNAVAFGGTAKGLNLPGGKATVVKDLSRTLRSDRARAFPAHYRTRSTPPPETARSHAWSLRTSCRGMGP